MKFNEMSSVIGFRIDKFNSSFINLMISIVKPFSFCIHTTEYRKGKELRNKDIVCQLIIA